MMNTIARLQDLIERHTSGDGIHASPISGLKLLRSAAPTLPMPVVYEPTFCLIAQGRKRVTLGNEAYEYFPARYLIASVDLPVVGTVTEASEEEPYLSISLDLDMALLAELAIALPAELRDTASLGAGLEVNPLTPELLDASARLLALLDTPGDIAALAPLVLREIHYRLLANPNSGLVRHLAQANSQLNRISQAIVWLRAHYMENFRIDQMADIAGMSRSTFHAHFRTVTALSPLEFRTQLRMQEARRLMMAEALSAASVAYRVGYESPSQFSRDYGRTFGVPPGKDVSALRQRADQALA
jgi:AraC-like DNA-binding protein